MHTWKRTTAAALLGLAVGLAAGCSSDGNPTAFVPGREPVVPGILLTDESGEAVGVFGRPIVFPDVSARPNPTIARVDIYFDVTEAGPVEALVLEASGPDDPPADRGADLAAGGLVFSPADFVVRTLVSEPLAVGPHALVWIGRDEDGARVPTGYYRVVVRQRSGTSFVDVFMVNPDDVWLPTGMGIQP